MRNPLRLPVMNASFSNFQICSAAVVAVLVSIVLASDLRAIDMFWDANGVTNGAGSTPNGNWDGVATNWTTASASNYNIRLGGAGNGRIESSLASGSVLLGDCQGLAVPPSWAGTWTMAGNQTLGGAAVTFAAGTTHGAGARIILGDSLTDVQSLGQPTLATNSTVSISNAVLERNFTGAPNTIAALMLGGVIQSAGVYNSNSHPALIAGDGSLLVPVAGGMASEPTNLTFRAGGGSLNLAWPATHLGWIFADADELSRHRPDHAGEHLVRRGGQRQFDEHQRHAGCDAADGVLPVAQTLSGLWFELGWVGGRPVVLASGEVPWRPALTGLGALTFDGWRGVGRTAAWLGGNGPANSVGPRAGIACIGDTKEHGQTSETG